MKSIERLLEDYHRYIRSDFIVEKIERDTYEIVTPFLDRRNDHITLYAIFKNNKIELTDDGYTLGDLMMSGIDIMTPKRKQEIESILLGHGVRVEGGEIKTVADEKNFPQKQHGIIQAVIGINDMYLTAREKITSIFIEEATAFFDEKKIVYVQGVNIDGKSGFSHKFDFIIPKQTRRNKKEALLKAINSPKKANIETTLFSFSDIGRDDDKYIILNDVEHPPSDEIFSALENYGIQPILWSHKEQIPQLLHVA